LTAGRASATASRLTDEVVTPKKRATPAPECPMPCTATWQDTRRAFTTAGRRPPDRNCRSVTPSPVLIVRVTV
jgi:hypothetical protein